MRLVVKKALELVESNGAFYVRNCVWHVSYTLNVCAIGEWP